MKHTEQFTTLLCSGMANHCALLITILNRLVGQRWVQALERQRCGVSFTPYTSMIIIMMIGTASSSGEIGMADVKGWEIITKTLKKSWQKYYTNKPTSFG